MDRDPPGDNHGERVIHMYSMDREDRGERRLTYTAENIICISGVEMVIVGVIYLLFIRLSGDVYVCKR
jgi:uncharacterized membrane protein YidH (DUF202 family)